MTTADLDVLERRRVDLREQVATIAKDNQARRMHVLLRARRQSTVVIVTALAVAFGIGATVGWIWFPTVQLYLQLCR